MADHYFTIAGPAVSEFKDRGSKFLGFAFPVSAGEEFKSHLTTLKTVHPKAAHYCFAYRIGTEGLVYRVSDDGEPSGSAGRPILGQVDSRKLTNVLIVIVRYFGGTLLGVPGLINAYKTTSSLALDAATIVEKAILLKYRLQFDYTRMNEVMQILKHFDCAIFKNETMLFCSIEAGIPKKNVEEVVGRFRDLRGVEVDSG